MKSPLVKLKTLMLVDPEVELRSIFAQYLESDGFHILEVSSAMHALQILSSGKTIDLIISDTHLGDRTGAWLLRQVSQRPHKIPFLFLSRNTVLKIDSRDGPNSMGVFHKPTQWELVRNILRGSNFF